MGHRLRRMGRATRPRPLEEADGSVMPVLVERGRGAQPRISARSPQVSRLRELQRKRRSRNEGFKGETAELALSLHASRCRPSIEGMRTDR
jgi:hypothetical protein